MYYAVFIHYVFNICFSGYDYSINFDNLLWLAEGKTQCNRQWIDENLFPVGHIEKGIFLFESIIRARFSFGFRQYSA